MTVSPKGDERAGFRGMGYSTYFSGGFTLDKKLTVSQIETLRELNDYTAEHPDGAPNDQCPWQPVEDPKDQGSDERACQIYSLNEEKMYAWDDWLVFLVEHYLEPWGVKISGQVIWQGEDTGDSGVIFAKNNRFKFVSIEEMPEPDWGKEDGETTATA